jgi:ubiquinone/menaquinone biosynthesis C-methylase UbiE
MQHCAGTQNDHSARRGTQSSWKLTYMNLPILENLDTKPNVERSLDSYSKLALAYDSTCTRIERLRLLAIDRLYIQRGETVIDVACGTGVVLPLLSQLVGKPGKVIGVEQSPEMAERARQRLDPSADNAAVVVSAMSDPQHDYGADAVLMCYTQDVLQSATDLDQLVKASKSGARIVILGMKTLPWIWGWPINLFNMFRARHYMTTYVNLDRPYRLLEQRGAKFQAETTALWGSAYIVIGTLP